MNQELTITLPIDTVNACLAALGKFPYENAQPHIDLLRGRASEALAAQAEQQPASAGMTE